MPIRREYSTITISVPSSQLLVSKGKVSSVKTLTKSGGLSTKENKKSIKIETNKGNEVVVKDEGRLIDSQTEKVKSKLRKEKAKSMSDEEFNKRFSLYKKV